MFERVYALWSFCDGPREGVADYDGRPHVFVSEWDEEFDDYGEGVLLKPITAETFRLVMEDTAIGRRREDAASRGLTTPDAHPASPEDRIRTEELKRLLRLPLTVDPARARQAYPVRTWQEPEPVVVGTEGVVRRLAEFCWHSAPVRWEELGLPPLSVRWSTPTREPGRSAAGGAGGAGAVTERERPGVLPGQVYSHWRLAGGAAARGQPDADPPRRVRRPPPGPGRPAAVGGRAARPAVPRLGRRPHPLRRRVGAELQGPAAGRGHGPRQRGHRPAGVPLRIPPARWRSDSSGRLE
jgi:hypothetical protein